MLFVDTKCGFKTALLFMLEQPLQEDDINESPS